MPDTQTWLLPMRAYLLSMRDQTLPVRRAAIADSQQVYQQKADHEHTRQLRVVGAVGDALQPVEDVAVMANAILEPIEGLPFYVGATVYDHASLNAFYEGAADLGDDRLLALAALRFEGIDIHEHYSWKPDLAESDVAALQAAYSATARLLRDHLIELGRAWARFAPYFLAFKHGALVTNPEDVAIVRAGQESARMAVWARRAGTIDVSGHHTCEHDELVEHALEIGTLALDFLDYLVATRLGIFEDLHIAEDGTATPVPGRPPSWQFWMRNADVGEENLSILATRLGIVLSPIITR